MASGFAGSYRPDQKTSFRSGYCSTFRAFALVFLGGSTVLLHGQMLMKAPAAGELITPIPSDVTILASGETRTDIPCSVTPRKPDLGFDLRFHAGYDVTIPLSELVGNGQRLTVIFRVYPQGDVAHAAYFAQHIDVPPISDDAKGDALIQGTYDLGEGTYQVDWLMRDRAERLCSSSWETEAALSGKDKPISLFISPNQITDAIEPFANDDSLALPGKRAEEGLNLKLLVNFAPQNSLSSSLQRSDTDALVSILRSIQHNPHVTHLSLVAFNVEQERVVWSSNSSFSNLIW